MSTGTAPAFCEQTAIKRKVPRFKLAVPLNLTVLRSGVPDDIPGHTVEIGEGGMGVVTAARLLVGESVRVEFLIPHMSTPVRATAVVRYQRDRCFGLEFLRLPTEQQSIIRYWTRGEGDLVLASQAGTKTADAPADPSPPPMFATVAASDRRFSLRLMIALTVATMVIAAVLGWWRWQQGWFELEGRLPVKENAVAQPQLRVPPEVMERRIIHRYMPEYPELAQLAGVQGSVLLDAVVGMDGSVSQVKVVRGPGELAPAALDAVRWWRYEPYALNGRPVTVQTTVTVNFRLAK